MKPKEDNLRSVSGFIILFLSLGLFGLSAQNVMDQNMPMHTRHVMIDLGFIENVRLKNSTGKNLEVISENDFGGRPNFKVTEKGGMLWIKSIPVAVENPENVDKDCVVQPVFPSYEIRIPKGKKVVLNIDEGNFYADGFYGDVTLNIERGLVDVSNLHGKMQVNINVGNVHCKLKHTRYDVQTNLGSIQKNDQPSGARKHLTGKIGNPVNELRIKALKANIYLNNPI